MGRNLLWLIFAVLVFIAGCILVPLEIYNVATDPTNLGGWMWLTAGIAAAAFGVGVIIGTIQHWCRNNNPSADAG